MTVLCHYYVLLKFDNLNQSWIWAVIVTCKKGKIVSNKLELLSISPYIGIQVLVGDWPVTSLRLDAVHAFALC